MDKLIELITIQSAIAQIVIFCIFAFIAVSAISTEKFWFLNLSLVVVLVLCSPLLKLLTFAAFLKWAAGYLATGIVWVIFKWGRYAEERILDYKRGQEERNRRGRGDDGADYRFLMNDVNPANNKSRITHWLFYWPFSVVDFCLTDLAKAIYDRISGVLKAYTARLLARHNVQPPSDL